MTYFFLGISLLVNVIILYIAWTFIRVPQNQMKPKSYQKPKAIEKSDPLRDTVIDELSRKKLVYAPEEKAYVARKQIN